MTPEIHNLLLQGSLDRAWALVVAEYLDKLRSIVKDGATEDDTPLLEFCVVLVFWEAHHRAVARAIEDEQE